MLQTENLVFLHEVDLVTTPPSAPHSSQPRSGHVADESWLNSCGENVEAQKHSGEVFDELQDANQCSAPGGDRGLPPTGKEMGEIWVAVERADVIPQGEIAVAFWQGKLGNSSGFFWNGRSLGD